MKITTMRVRKLYTDGDLIGAVTLSLDNMFVINDIRILKKPDGFAVVMPGKSLKNGKFKTIVYAMNNEVKEAIERLSIAAYQFCNREGMMRAQFNVCDEIDVDSLLEQSLDDFMITYIQWIDGSVENGEGEDEDCETVPFFEQIAV